MTRQFDDVALAHPVSFATKMTVKATSKKRQPAATRKGKTKEAPPAGKSPTIGSDSDVAVATEPPPKKKGRHNGNAGTTAAAKEHPIAFCSNITLPEELAYQPTPKGCIKIVSYNVNSLAAALKKDLKRYIIAEDPEIICLQETKAGAEVTGIVDTHKYHYRYWANSTQKKGYGR